MRSFRILSKLSTIKAEVTRMQECLILLETKDFKSVHLQKQWPQITYSRYHRSNPSGRDKLYSITFADANDPIGLMCH